MPSATDRSRTIVLLLTSALTVMAGAVVAPSLPGMGEHFADAPDVLVKLILTMPALMIALAGGPVGYLADRFGRTRLLLTALALYGASGFMGFVADGLIILLISRALLGIAVAGIISISTALAGDYFSLEQRTRFLGLQGGFMAMGGIVFLNLGGLLAEWGWRTPFLIYLCSLALLPIAWRVLDEPVRSTPDAASRRAGALTPTHRRQVGLIYTLALAGMALLYVAPTQLPFLLSHELGVSSTLVGVAVSSTTVVSAGTSFLYHRVRRHLSFAGIYVLAFLMIAMSYLIVGTADSYALKTAGIACSGFGLGLFMPNSTVWLMSMAGEHARGRIMGGYTSMFFLGQFVSPIIAAPFAALSASLNGVFIGAAALAATLAGITAAVSALSLPSTGGGRR